MGKLDGQVALITGGARGQGRAHAVLFAEEGADIAVCDICGETDAPYSHSTIDDLEETRRLVEKAGGRCLTGQVDVRDLGAMQSFAADVIAEFGRIDILCANAGILTKSVIAEMSAHTWQTMVDTNLTGVFNSFRAVLPYMIERKRGSIVATSSMAARNPHGSIGHYTAAKFGVIGLVKSTAIEVGPVGIRVNAICPTNVNTEMALNPTVYSAWCPDIEDPTKEDVLERMSSVHPLRVPYVEPEDVSRQMLYLVSDDARYVTGEVLTVSAGLIAFSDG
ncbi:mycofactocin-coupled SDR family oxidoreductase [Jatrophihabitans sp.]|uniref:mycofactocin-coupled SDR family oxidoreductase n=1 Tax=Jatrophihabitans sp. TaxID=1932789 RepID=UPI0030C6DEE7|nr:short-chain dehydrogenase/reductase [Jatrophihabitans sp.]